MLQLFRQLMWLGVDETIPRAEAKHHILANIVAAIAVAQNLPLLAEATLTRNGPWFAYQISVTLSYAPVFVLRARKLHSAATTCLASLALLWCWVSPVFIATKSATQNYLLVVGLGVFLIFPVSCARRATLFSALALVSFVVVGNRPEFPSLFRTADMTITMTRVNHVIVAALFFLLGYYNRSVVSRAEFLLEAERQRSERLLLNVLPAAIAARLKTDEESIADKHEEATVLFADIVGFTPMSAGLPPEDLVERLNAVFTKFDAITERHGLEKIKTIGDCYMVAGGVPEPRVDHAEAVAQTALEMIRVIEKVPMPGGTPLALRIGVHSGPLIAGVIGKQKFAYDLWGDTVNTASRMESHGMAGRVHVSSAAYRRLRDRFEFEERGRINVKGKGEMLTYFLKGARCPSSTQEGKGAPVLLSSSP